jgi:hypothetical protein
VTREDALREAAILSSTRMGGADFDPRLEVVGSRRPPPRCSVCWEPVDYPSQLDASGRCSDCTP